MTEDLKLDRHGWLCPHPAVRHVRSPNQDRRPPLENISLLVIHNISLPPNQFGNRYVEQLFTNTLRPEEHPFFAQIADLRVSAHFYIRRSGRIVQFVSTDRRAWHAGASRHDGRDRCNDFSIGIEMEGTDFEPFTDEQYLQLAALTTVLRNRYTLNAVRGHEHIAPKRKTDPGPYFDWHWYQRLTGWTWRQMPPGIASRRLVSV